jgi:dolichyl-diphosphooligosaccharide--protein glycosyltransferase
VTFVEKHPWLMVAALCLLALVLRTVPQYDNVFQGSFVNFQETDAWYHVRTVDNLVHHFPRRMQVDPYLAPGQAQNIPTGPFYDWLIGGIAWAAGFGHPSEQLVHVVAAWYPAVLGVLIVAVVFLLARRMFGVRAALVATAIIATLPGHFFAISSLGFTDHHVMESLLSALFLFLLLRAMDAPASNTRALLAGLTLAAYLLTFVGGAFFVAIVVAWAAFDRVRSFWPREEPASAGRPLYISFLIAAALIAPFYRLLWMPYSIAALVLGAAGLFVLERWVTLSGSRAAGLTGLAVVVAAASLAVIFVPSLKSAMNNVLPFLSPALFGHTGAVSELQSLITARQGLSVAPAWSQFAGAYVLSIVGLALLAEAAWKKPQRGATLAFFWGACLFALAMGQLRMTYYFGVAAAVVSGYLVARIFDGDPRPAVRWALAAALLAGVFVPNINAALTSGQIQHGLSSDWKQAMDWLRASTPEPFGDAAFYYASYSPPAASPSYSVMAWWDYGHWIEAAARRVPVTNPTQNNASAAAAFFLTQSETEALDILARFHARYAIVSSDLPLLMDNSGAVSGEYPALFTWDKTKNVDDYVLVAIEPVDGERVRARLLYRPAYYRSMAVRLFLGGADGIANPPGAAVAYFTWKANAAGKPYRILSDLRRFESVDEAEAAQHECQPQGCALVGENPQISCVRLDPFAHFRAVFASDTAAFGTGRAERRAVQIYEVLP